MEISATAPKFSGMTINDIYEFTQTNNSRNPSGFKRQKILGGGSGGGLFKADKIS